MIPEQTTARDRMLSVLNELVISDNYREWQRQHERDFAGFLINCVRWPEGTEPTAYQLEAARALGQHTQVAIRGPRRLGKTAFAALSVLWFALVHDGWVDWKILTTAGSWRQVGLYLWPEIHKWAGRLRWGVIGRDPLSPNRELLHQSMRLSTGQAFGAVSKSSDLVEGAHASAFYVIFDEAKAIGEEIFDAVEAMLAGGKNTTSLALAISTPGSPQGRFYDIHRKRPGLQSWWTRHVTIEEVLAAEQVSADWVAEKGALWGVESFLYRQYVLGEFAAESTDGIIPLAWVEAAIDRWRGYEARNGDTRLGYLDPKRRGEFIRLGVDVGISHDKTVFAPLYGGLLVDQLERYGPLDAKTATMQVVGYIRNRLASEGGTSAHARIDSIGIGAGVYNRLQELGYQNATAFVASGKTTNTDTSGEIHFSNKRTAAWWNLRELLDPGQPGERVCLPPDDLLTGDLTAPTYKQLSSGLQIESKDLIRKRLKRSTDSADAVIMALYEDQQGVLFA